MSFNLKEPEHTQLYELTVVHSLEKPKSFGCNHNRDVCTLCHFSVLKFIQDNKHLILLESK